MRKKKYFHSLYCFIFTEPISPQPYRFITMFLGVPHMQYVFRAGGSTRFDTNMATINARCRSNYHNLIIIQIIKVQVRIIKLRAAIGKAIRGEGALIKW